MAAERPAASAAPPRRLPRSRWIRTGLRTAHLAAMAGLYGGHVWAVDAERLVPYLAATVATGAGLLAVDAWRAPVSLVQVRGLATYVKILLVAAVHWLWEWRVALLSGALVIGAVSSHMPGRLRYHSFLHGGPVGSREPG